MFIRTCAKSVAYLAGFAIYSVLAGLLVAQAVPVPYPRPDDAPQLPVVVAQAPAPAPVPAPPVVNVNVPPAPPLVVAPPPPPTWWDTARNTAEQFLLWLGALLVGIVVRYSVPIGQALTQFVVDWAKGKGIEVDEARRARIQNAITNGLHGASAVVEKDASGKVAFKDKGTLINLAVAYAQAHAASDIKALGSDPAATQAIDALKARAEVALADPTVSVSVAKPSAPPSPEAVTELVRREVAAALAAAHVQSPPGQGGSGNGGSGAATSISEVAGAAAT